MLLGGTALLLTVVLFLFAFRNQNTVQKFFEQNKTELTAIAKDILASKSTDQQSLSGVSQIDFWDGEYPMIEFYLESLGIGSSASYTGIYYSPQDIPLPFQNADLPLTPEDGGYSWKGEGDNYGYVKRLAPNWYLFEAYF